MKNFLTGLFLIVSVMAAFGFIIWGIAYVLFVLIPPTVSVTIISVGFIIGYFIDAFIAMAAGISTVGANFYKWKNK